MAIEIECPKCEMCYAAPDHLAGETVKCTECGAEIVVPFILEIVETDESGLADLLPEKPKATRPSAGGAKPQRTSTQQPSARKPSAQKPKPSGPAGQRPTTQRQGSLRATAPKPASQTPAPKRPPLGPQQYDPLSGLLDDGLTAGPAAQGPAGMPQTPARAGGPWAGTGGPWSGGPAGGGALPPIRRERAASSGSSPFLGLIGTHPLASVLAVVVVVASLFNLLWTSFWLALIVLAIGTLIVFAGFKSDPDRPIFTAPDFSEEAGGCAAVGGGALLFLFLGFLCRAHVQGILSGSGGSRTGLGVLALTALVVLLVTGGAVLFFLFRFLARMFGGFRTAAVTYMTLGVMHVMLVGLGLALFGAAKYASQGSFGRPGPPESIDKIAVPEMPERPASRMLEPGVQFAEVRLSVPPDQPGHESTLYVYTPSGRHEPKSLACILIAPAGTNLLSGMKLGEGDRVEHIPYVKAGMAVVAYEIDGPYSHPPDRITTAEARDALRKYSAARAGLVNARNALEFVLARMPEVDPYRIYAAGHSSAATLALLFAQEEKRLRGCIAYAPATDLRKRFGSDLWEIEREVPGASDVVFRYSPDAGKYPGECPLFLFHAEDDTNVPVSNSKNFARRLKQSGKDVTLVTVSRGNHYDSMIHEGIPRAIAWLKGRQPAAPVATDWEAKPDPLPASSAKLDAIALKTTEREVWQVRFSGPQAARAVVLNRPADRRGDHYFIDTYDLARRRYLGRFSVPRLAQLTDVSPDGRRALTVTESRVHVWSLEEGRPLVDWEITVDGETGRGPACFVGTGHVLTNDTRNRVSLDRRDRMILWSLPECKPAYAVKGVCDVALSPGRKYAVAFLNSGGGSAATVYEAASGKPCGSLPSPPGAHGRYDPHSWAFSRDGRLLAACGGPIAVWDFRDGKLVAESSRGLSSGNLQFLGKDFLIQGGDLFDRSRDQRIWRYEHPSSSTAWLRVFGSPDDRVWTLVARSYREPAYLVPLELPDRETRAAIASGSLPGPRERPRTSQISFNTVFGARQPPGPLAERVPPGYGQGAEALVSTGSHTVPRPPVGPTVSPRKPPDTHPLGPKPRVGPTRTWPAKKLADEEPPPSDLETASRDYVRRFYAETISADDTAVVGMVQWLPAAKRPVLGVRWGVGLYDADAEEQPPAGDAAALGRLTGEAGSALMAGLEKRMAAGAFGIWPEEGDPRLRQVALLGSGRRPELIGAAGRRGLDLLIVLTLSKRTLALSKKELVMLRPHIFDAVSGRQLWTGDPFSTEHARKAGLAGEILKEIDDKFRLVPVPRMRPEHAASRVARLAATTSTRSEPAEQLRVLVELRYYQARGLVKAESLVPVYDRILGPGKGRTMATGTAAQRRKLLAEGLQGR